MNSPTGSSDPVPSGRGVFPADAFNPPPPPPGARARVLKDSNGEIIAYGWVRGRDDGPAITDFAWDWLDTHDLPLSVPAAVTSHLTLLRAD